VARSTTSLSTAKLEAAVPLKDTAVTPVKCSPWTVTSVPTGPLVGAKEVIEGGRGTVKLEALVAVPSGLVIVIVPVVVPAATVARSEMSLSTAKLEAAVPLKDTAVTPVKREPWTVTSVPTGPLVGAKEMIEGGRRTVKLEALVAVPPGPVMLIGPEPVAAATVARSTTSLSTAKLEAAVPLKDTAVTPVKREPWTVTSVPTGPLVGAKEVIEGGRRTVKLEALVAVPPGPVTVMAPVVVPAATVARSTTSLSTAKLEAAVPLKDTAVTPVKREPWTVTSVPIGPLVGAKEVIEGGRRTVKLEALVAVPPGPVAVMVPVVVPAATVARSTTSLSTAKLEAAVPLKDTAVTPVKREP
jgi:hypothetical protein